MSSTSQIRHRQALSTSVPGVLTSHLWKEHRFITILCTTTIISSFSFNEQELQLLWVPSRNEQSPQEIILGSMYSVSRAASLQHWVGCIGLERMGFKNHPFPPLTCPLNSASHCLSSYHIFIFLFGSSTWLFIPQWTCVAWILKLPKDVSDWAAQGAQRLCLSPDASDSLVTTHGFKHCHRFSQMTSPWSREMKCFKWVEPLSPCSFPPAQPGWLVLNKFIGKTGPQLMLWVCCGCKASTCSGTQSLGECR